MTIDSEEIRPPFGSGQMTDRALRIFDNLMAAGKGAGVMPQGAVVTITL